MLFAPFRCSLSLGEMESFLGGTYPLFLPSKTASFISLTLGMALFPEIDFEIPEHVDFQRSARVHDDRGVGRLDDGRAPDRVPRNKEGAVVNRRGRRLLKIGPVDLALAAPGLRIDFRRESFRPRELWPRSRGRGAQAQRHDLQACLAVGRTAPVQLLVARIEALVQPSPERGPDALLRQHHLDLIDLALVAHV